MRVFMSVGEPSGDLHGSHLIQELRKRCGDVVVTGFGGDRMAQAGQQLLFKLADYPIIGILPAIAHVPMLKKLLRDVGRQFDNQRPDVVVLIDYPGFNWHVARAAKKRGIPVVYFLAPQMWAWASWRIAKVRRFVDHVLCSLPFEVPWYQERGYQAAEYVGHPFFDHQHEHPIDEAFLATERAKGDGPVVALLPGSRNKEVAANTADILAAAEQVTRAVPGVRFLIAAFKPSQAETIAKQPALARLPAVIHVGKTTEIMKLATAAISVSGSVSLELMYHQVPTAIVYRLPWFSSRVMVPLLKQCPYFTLVNMIAGRMLYPEFIDCRDYTRDVATIVSGWLENPWRRDKLRRDLGELKQQFALPGATGRVADFVCDLVGRPHRQAAAA